MSEIDKIERDLSESRASLKNNVSALSEKLTLGRIIDEMLMDSNINWDRVGDKAGHSLKSAMPGAVIGAGIAMLFASGGLSGVLRNANGASKTSRYQDGFNPIDDWRTDTLYRAIEAFERDSSKSSNEDDGAYHARRINHYADVMGHQKSDGEDDNAFRTRIDGAAEKLKVTAAGARDRLKSAASGAADKAGELFAGAEGGLKSVSESISEKTSAAAGAAKHGVKNGAAQLQTLFEKNPAVGIAVGLGVGALLGTAIPITKEEEKALHEPLKKATLAAADMTSHLSEKAGAVIGAGIDSAKQAMREASDA